MNKGTLWAGAAVVLVGLLGWGGYRLLAAPKVAPASPPQATVRSGFTIDSKALLGNTLPEVSIGMLQPELQRVRPRAVRLRPADNSEYLVLNEALPNGDRVLYSFNQGTLSLDKVQIASKLQGLADVAPRIALMQSRYGTPNAVWDCPPAEGQLPTRRFTYLRTDLAAMDSYLVAGEQVAATLYVAKARLVGDSLKQGNCVMATKETFARFPTLPITANSQPR